MAVDTRVLSLSELGNVPLTYTHEWRVAEPHEPLVLPGAIFKWYHVHREGVAIPAAMDAEARAIVTDALAAGHADFARLSRSSGLYCRTGERSCAQVVRGRYARDRRHNCRHSWRRAGNGRVDGAPLP